MDLMSLDEALRPLGMNIFGWFAMTNGPAELEGNRSALIGNHGTAMWDQFKKSSFAHDNGKHPLDRWTKANIAPLAASLNATALYPFLDSRQKHWPFQQWASDVSGLQQSPQGMLIDPDYGLWHAFRAVLVFGEKHDLAPKKPISHPCSDCVDKPCLTTCPVNAISNIGFDAAACVTHVKSSAGIDCRSKGCIARNACPVGRKYAYDREQQAFHMRAFIGE